ncbi:hypothetical protein B0H13DRAFT_2306911 [Mycena leptocephala]|nr:hypothetical protein B0H13DRAFT_2306911 [Mycena leptocephala]
MSAPAASNTPTLFIAPDASLAPASTPSAAHSSTSAPPVQRSDSVTSLAPTESLSTYLANDATDDLDSNSAVVHSTSTPIAAPDRNKGKERQRNASPGPSSSTHLPPGRAAARNFIANVGLREVLPDSHRLESKPEIRGLQREIHALTQGVAEHIRLSTDTAETHASSINSVSLYPSRLSRLANPNQVLQNQLVGMNMLLDDVASSLLRIEARQVSPPPPGTPAAAIAHAPPVAAPSPLPDVALVAPSASSAEGRLMRVEGILAELSTSITSLKRARSPSPTHDTRNVRPHLEDAPPMHAHTASPPGIFHAPAVPVPPAAIVHAPTVATPPPTRAAPPPGVIIAPAAAVHAPSAVPASSIGPTTPAGILVAPTVNRRGKATEPTIRYLAREVRMGPAVWNKDITQQALLVIQVVLPQYQWTNVFIHYDLMILNGVERFGPNSGGFTSFQGTRKTVIDYVICSKSLYPKITAFKVLPRKADFDHAALVVQLEVDPALLTMNSRV